MLHLAPLEIQEATRSETRHNVMNSVLDFF